MHGAIDEFSFYAGVLQSADISAARTIGRDVLLATNVSLAVSQSSGALNLNWPVTASGFVVQSSPALGENTVWIVVTNAVSIAGSDRSDVFQVAKIRGPG